MEISIQFKQTFSSFECASTEICVLYNELKCGSKGGKVIVWKCWKESWAVERQAFWLAFKVVLMLWFSFVVYLDNCENGHSVFSHLCSFRRAKLRNHVFSLFNLKQKQSKLNAISKYTSCPAVHQHNTHSISLCNKNLRFYFKILWNSNLNYSNRDFGHS